MSKDKHAAGAPRAVIDQRPAAPVSPGAEGASKASAPAEGSVSAEGAAPADGARFQDATWGFIEGIGHAAWTYADAHPHTVLYAAVGLVLAVLILVVGLWHTIVLAIFTGVGALVGRMRDGEGDLSGLFGKIFGGKR